MVGQDWLSFASAALFSSFTPAANLQAQHPSPMCSLCCVGKLTQINVQASNAAILLSWKASVSNAASCPESAGSRVPIMSFQLVRSSKSGMFQHSHDGFPDWQRAALLVANTVASHLALNLCTALLCGRVNGAFLCSLCCVGKLTQVVSMVCEHQVFFLHSCRADCHLAAISKQMLWRGMCFCPYVCAQPECRLQRVGTSCSRGQNAWLWKAADLAGLHEALG
ncbi:hypothetical protein WJX73_007774 [Symbiochloris irregularis]|uniref:Secreted protein n=1 Tax=Symbiochloris irregularis TaxID=706552 RepID=A0AAW1NZF3_9CHLO